MNRVGDELPALRVLGFWGWEIIPALALRAFFLGGEGERSITSTMGALFRRRWCEGSQSTFDFVGGCWFLFGGRW